MILLVVYSNSADNSIAPKTGYNAPSQHLLEGDNAMVSHHVFSGSVLDVEIATLNQQSKSISVDKQTNDNVVHLRRFGETNRLPDQTFNPCP